MNSELVSQLTYKTMKGDTPVKPTNKPEWFDYAAAHPFAVPLWVAMFGWQVQTFGIGWYWLVPLFFFALWFYGYLDSAPRLFAHYSRNSEEKEVSPCSELAKT